MSGKVRCIASATPAEHHAALEKAPWLNERFLAVKVEPPTEETAIKILQVEKDRFEKFHSVQYTDEAITAAVVLSNRLIANHSLPDKAIDVVDDAGAYVKMKQEKAVLPEEVIEARKRLKFIAARHENAVENHEFEKARFYSDEERTQREALAQLHLKHNIPERQVVAKEDIERGPGAMDGNADRSCARGRKPFRNRKPEAEDVAQEEGEEEKILVGVSF